jgi:hypothetical protein
MWQDPDDVGIVPGRPQLCKDNNLSLIFQYHIFCHEVYKMKVEQICDITVEFTHM